MVAACSGRYLSLQSPCRSDAGLTFGSGYQLLPGPGERDETITETLEKIDEGDATGYDPENSRVLYVLTNDRSRWMIDHMAENNQLYELGLVVMESDQTSAWSDHRPFWDNGYRAVVTHSEVYGPGHTSNDNVDKVSTPLEARNAKLCLSALADLAGFEAVKP